MIIQLQPVYGPLNEALVTLLSGVAIWIATSAKEWLENHAKFLSEKTDTELANGLNRALSNGVQIAMQKANDLESQYPGIPVKNQIAAWAAQYAVDHSPGAMARFGKITPEDLALKALAYLPPVMARSDDGSISPVTAAPVEVHTLPTLK